uniref:Myosin motor domain-containing protein n=1 Tax=Cyprinodon variegatus TaxID=28743 RepID=A0A3Q2D827_CYPVA
PATMGSGQANFQAFLVRNKMRNEYLQKKTACIALQAAFRGMRVRAEQRKKHQAATVIQSVVKMFLCRKRYILLQHSVITVQVPLLRIRGHLNC